MTINLCTNCQHNYQGLECLKSKLVYPNAQACPDTKSKTNVMAIVTPIKKVTTVVTPPVVTFKQKEWRFMAKDDPTKCVFNAYLP